MVDAKHTAEIDLQQANRRARAFARHHVGELAREIVEWQDTALLREGKLRELASIVSFAGHDALKVAEHYATRAALDARATSTDTGVPHD